MASRKDLSTDQSSEIKVNFVADVHLIQILGEQLIGSEKVGILELIKNAYDAGATKCDVWIEKVPGLPEVHLSDPQIANLEGPVITITDNGRGMDENIIKQGWLRPATRIKTSVKEILKRERQQANKRGTRSEYEQLVKTLKDERGGRLPLGEKGVGRFATHRLGKHLILQTKTADEFNEWVLRIDWDDFQAPDDKPLDLDSIPLTLIKQKPQRDYGPNNSGTMLRIFGGREGFEWTDEIVRDTGNAITLITSPSRAKIPTGFETFFFCPQLSDQKFEAPVNTVFAPFRCVAIVDENGYAEIDTIFSPSSSLSKPISENRWKKTKPIDLKERNIKYWSLKQTSSRPFRKPECGPFTLDIKLWIRDSEWIESPNLKTFTKYLDEFGGVGIYRDGLSILPAQIASKDDWLGLSKRHIKRGEHISYYQMWGSVDLVQENTLGLIDRTSREGMLDSRPYKDLRELVLPIIYELEEKVIETRDRYNKLMQGEKLPEAVLTKRVRVVSDILKRISTHYDFKKDSLKLIDIVGESESPAKSVANIAEVYDELKREVRELKNQSDALLEAAGYGIAISVAVHEIEKVTSNLYFGLGRFSKMAKGLSHENHEQLEQLSNTSQTLLNELKRISPLKVTRLEQQRLFKVRDCILAASGAFKLTWDEKGISCILPSKDNDFEVLGSFGACSQVFANLFDNATYWLQAVETDRMRIAIQVDPLERKVVLADSGRGLDDDIRAHLFKLFYSLKSPPSGLGLYISRYYMRQMKGTIRESLPTERIPGFEGAQFTIIFPKEKGAEE